MRHIFRILKHRNYPDWGHSNHHMTEYIQIKNNPERKIRTGSGKNGLYNYRQIKVH